MCDSYDSVRSIFPSSATVSGSTTPTGGTTAGVVLPPLRAVQPLERYYRRKIRYNRSISTTKHCSIFSVVATCSFSASGCNPLILVGFLCVLFVCVCSGGSSSHSAPRKTKKRARGTLHPVVSDEEEEVVTPTKPTRREKSAAAKQRVVMPLHRWKAKDWEAYRSKNPYGVPIAPCWTTVQFRNEMQV